VGVLLRAAGLLVGVRAPDADETCCRDVLPLAVEYLKVEGEFERVDAGLPWLEALLILLVSLGRREVGDAGEVGCFGGSMSSLAVGAWPGRLHVGFDPATSLCAREW
jgi:hypothetical protein